MIRISKHKSLVILLTVITMSLSCGGGGKGKSGAGSGIVPLAPVSITASEGLYTDRVEITWAQTEGAEYYVLYKSIDNKDLFRAVATSISGVSYTDSKITPERIYYYKVAAGCGELWSDPSIDARGFAHNGKPLVPETVTSTSDQIGQIVITWSAAPQVDSYKILRSDSESGDFIEIATGITSTSYTDNPPARDKTYYYRIVSVSSTQGESDPGEIISGMALQDIPAVPSNVKATNGTYGNKVDITWDTALNAVTYIVYRAPDESGAAGVYEKIGENIIGLIFEDTTATPDLMYHYAVTAVSSGGESSKSTDAAGKIATGAPIQTAAPSNVKASDGNFDTITVTWNAVDGAASYSVYRSETRTGTYTVIAGADKIASMTFTDTPPSLITHYFYRVTSWTSIESYSSIPDEGHAMPRIADVPSGLTATTDHSDGTIIINWTASARADKYNIYRADKTDGTYNLLASGVTALTYTDEYPSINVGKIYYYRITAVNVSGESAQSAEAQGNTVLAVPSNFTGSYSSKQITLTWTTVKGATLYKIQRRTNLLSSWSDLTNTDQITYSDTSVSVGLVHYYRIQAISADTTSEYTDSLSVYAL